MKTTKKIGKNFVVEEIEKLLPKKIRKFAKKTLIYLFLPIIHKNYSTSALCYYYSPKHKSCIFVQPAFWSRTRKEQEKIIFHEIAHIWLHFHNKKNNEKEANKLCNEWKKT